MNLHEIIKTANDKVSLCIHHGNDNITMIGTAKIVTDMTIKEEMWIDWFINHYKEGVKDPEYCVIEFTSNELSLWLNRVPYHVSVEEILKVGSRCGLICHACSFKESHNCKGCIATNGNPFYGECAIAICCQDKGYNHCGECSDMPCEELNAYSCGDGEHCDSPKGSRLEMLKMW